MKNENFNFDAAKVYNLLHTIIQSNQEVLKTLEEIMTKITDHKRGESLQGILFIEDIRVLLGLSTSTIYRYVYEGILPASKIGSRYIFYEKDIKTLIDQNYKGFRPKSS